MDKEPAYLELMFRPSVDLVSIVRRFVTDFYRSVFIDPETSSRLALATHELLENAVKYSMDGETRMRVQIARDVTPCPVSIRTWNVARQEDITTLHRVFRDMNGTTDAFAFYQQRMRETVQHDEGSGLGIVRIRAEADMTLSFETTGSTVCITAETFAELRRDDETDRRP